MKKKIFGIFLAFAICFSTMGIVHVSAASTRGYDYNTAKIATLAFTQCTTDGVQLKGDFDWNSFAYAGEDGVVIIPSWGSTNMINQQGLDPSHYAQMADTMAQVIDKLCQANSSLKIWIGTQGVSDNCKDPSNPNLFYINGSNWSSIADSFQAYLADVHYDLLDSPLITPNNSYWTNNIQGIYYNGESIYSTVINSFGSDPSDNTNPQFLMLNKLSSYAHYYLNKDFLWIPYYDLYSDIGKYNVDNNIAYIADRTNIFDCVILQPHYWATNNTDSLTGVDNSVMNQQIETPSGGTFYPHTSNTTIGVEMECDLTQFGVNNFSDYVNRFGKYITGSTYRGTEPIGFYWGGDPATTLPYMNYFFTYGDLYQSY